MERGIEVKAWDRARWSAFALIFACLALSQLLPSGGGIHAPIARALLRQDVAVAAVPLLFCLARRSAGAPAKRAPEWLSWALAFAILLIGWAGAHLWLDFPLSRDEQMANFDAAIFARGRLFAPLAPEWRAHLAALNMVFVLPVDGGAGWVSAYLPGNAALRALVGTFDPALTGPLLAGVGALALWSVARRLWPDSPGARLVALVFYASSSQLIVTAMTAYAMTAHLALNLLWLALFLRGGRAGHAGAILTGFVATGLHQPVFHPLFVAPFLMALAWRREWRPLALYVLAYMGIVWFWTSWFGWLGGSAVGARMDYAARALGLIRAAADGGLWAMTANLLRFTCWQHPLLVPLALFGMWSARREPLALAMAGGVALMIGVAALVLPFQGHGWGYRYLHGLIGSFCLLGGYGWRRLEAGGVALTRPMAAATVAALALLPLHLWMAARLIEPVRAATYAAAAMPADFVVIEDRAAPYGNDLVSNRADLSNRPILLLSSALAPAELASLCAHRTVAFVDAPMLAGVAANLGYATPPSGPHLHELRAAAMRTCRVIQPVRPASTTSARTGQR